MASSKKQQHLPFRLCTVTHRTAHGSFPYSLKLKFRKKRYPPKRKLLITNLFFEILRSFFVATRTFTNPQSTKEAYRPKTIFFIPHRKFFLKKAILE